jgi:hypothetical protein
LLALPVSELDDFEELPQAAAAVASATHVRHTTRSLFTGFSPNDWVITIRTGTEGKVI